MKTSSITNELYFLTGGGEMGKMIRDFDWSQTELGEPSKWPQSLRTMVSVMLENPFGMYIAWGDDYIQLYNDAYRPILGSSKHPQALGLSSRETFKEIWHIIGDMFDGVMKGKAVGFPDFMLPLNRNSYVEKCYFDFSYSPIRKENGEVGGILVTVIETTSKKLAEEELKKEKNRFRNMADNIPNLAWMADAEGYIFWYNKKWYEFTGKTPREMEGWGWQSVHDPLMLPTVLERWKESIYTGKPFEMVFPLKGADGKFRQFLTRVLPLYDEDGKVNQWFGINTDITAQTQTELSLKESEERFRTMAEGTDILIATSDATSNATYFNSAWIKFTGRTLDELINFGWTDLIHADDRPQFLDLYREAFSQKKSWKAEFRILNKNGEYRWLMVTGPARFNSDGSFAGYISSGIDITDTKELLTKVLKSEQRVRSLVESAPFPISVYVGKEMRIELANQAIIDAWGKGNDVIGKSLKEILPELNNQDIFRQIDDVFSTGEPFHGKNQRVDLEINNKLQPYYFNYNFTPLFDAKGEVYGVMNTAADVTDLNLAKIKLEEAQDKARLAIDSAQLGVYEIVYSTNEMITDKRFKEIWGVKPTVKREEYAAVIHPDDQTVREKAHKQSLQSGNLYYKARVIWEDNSVHWVRITGKVIYDKNNKPEKLLGVIQDITESEIAKKKIEESERNLRQTILQAPVAMCFLKDNNFVVELANERMYELWGTTGEAVMGKPIFEGLPQAKGQGFEELLEGVYTTGETFSALGVPINLPRNGKVETVYINFVYEAYHETDGTISGVLAVAVDVTDQILAKQKIEEVVAERTKELADANYNLQKSNSELAQFAYIASHDLQEPLRKISTFTQMLEKSLGENINDHSKNYIQKISTASSRMNRLI
ncbi:MAG: sensor signal transduction histidine kinase, partial [Bacteroidetes bacterium]|nr:sensor signal transduction histidine kinase [Bacteroidota bacterium]